MPVLVESLIGGRDKPTCVEQDTTLHTALQLMLKYDYSQLPIVDRRGQLVGIVSEQSILRTYYDYNRTFSLDLTVNDCSAPPEVMKGNDELSQVLDRIKDVDAIVIVDDANKPVGILTDYDTTQSLRDLYEVYTLLEDIETSIAQLIENVLETQDIQQAALFRAFGADKREPSKPNRMMGKLDLHDKVQLIITDDNWNRFEPVLKQKRFFEERMNRISDIRNPLFHFERRPDTHEYEMLRAAAQWAKSLRYPATQPAKKQTVSIDESVPVATGEHARKYDPLQEWLGNRPEDMSAIRVKFADMEKLLGASLPPTAYEHPSWWANVKVGRSQSRAWLDAGWRVADVDFGAREVTFQRLSTALNQQFFADLLQRLKKTRPGITHATKTQRYSWFWFGAGRAGVSFGWAFHHDDVLSVELAIDSPNKETNKRYFAKLSKDKNVIETEIGQHLVWEEMQEAKLSRVRINRKCKVTDPPEELEKAKVWALDMILKFIDAFQPRIKSL